VSTAKQALAVAVIGCGFMGRRHIAGYGALKRAHFDNAEVVAVLDLDRSAAEAAAEYAQEQLGLKPRVHTVLEDLLADRDVEAVDIVTEPRTHASIAIAAMEAGRHVLCEKPLALTIRSARSMLDVAARTGVTLGTAENYRRGGANRLAKAVIESGMLGDIHLFREFHTGGDNKVIISKWRHMKQTGAIGLDMGIHYADVIEYLIGRVDRVWGRGVIAEPLRFPAGDGEPIVPDGEDSIFASMITERGVDIQLAYLPSGPGRYDERTIHGTRGSMEIPPDRTAGPVVVHLTDRTLVGSEVVAELGESFQLSPVTVAVLGSEGSGGVSARWADVDAGYLAVELYDFADAILDGREPEVTGEGGMRALAIVLAALESGWGRAEVSVQDVLDGTVHAYQDDIDEALARSR
jgi:predicted dehydrogenase